MMLHTINKSPFERNALQSCLRLAKKGGAVLLIEDGVYAACQGTEIAGQITERMADMKFFVLQPDIAARGLAETPLLDGITPVDYGGFVDLVAEYEVTQAWL